MEKNKSSGVIISDNTKGNPYHEAGSGEFTSKENAGEAVSNDTANSVKKKGSKLLAAVGISNNKNKLLSTVSNYFNSEEDELEKLFNELKDKNSSENIDSVSNGKKINIYALSDEDFLNIVKEADPEDIYETIINDYTIDKDKVKNLTREEYEKILIAQKTILGEGNYSALEEYNQDSYEGLWKDPVKPSDYPSKEFSIKAKLDYFENSYNKEDKQEKINALNDFVEKGKIYKEHKDEIDEKIEKAHDFLDKYSNWGKRKNSALWLDGPKDYDTNETNEKIKIHFGEFADKVINKFGKESNEIASMQKYTSSFSRINEPLRGETYYGSAPDFVSDVENMTRAIDASVIDFDFWAERGTNAIIDSVNGININSSTSDADLSKLVGKSFVQHSFCSASVHKFSSFDRDIKMNIFCPRGTKGFYVGGISSYTYEREMVLQRGYSYKITKAYKSQGTIYIDCEIDIKSDSQKYDKKKLEEIAKTNITGNY